MIILFWDCWFRQIIRVDTNLVDLAILPFRMDCSPKDGIKVQMLLEEAVIYFPEPSLVPGNEDLYALECSEAIEFIQETIQQARDQAVMELDLTNIKGKLDEVMAGVSCCDICERTNCEGCE